MRKKSLYNYSACEEYNPLPTSHEVAVCYTCILVVLRYPLLSECGCSSGPPLIIYVTCTKVSWTGPTILAWAFIYIPSIGFAASTKLSWTGLYIFTEPPSTSLLFSAICKGPGDTAPMWSLVRSFDVHLCDKYQTIMNWPIKSKWVWSGNTTITYIRPTHGTVRSSHRILTSRKTVKVRYLALSSSSRWLQN